MHLQLHIFHISLFRMTVSVRMWNANLWIQRIQSNMRLTTDWCDLNSSNGIEGCCWLPNKDFDKSVINLTSLSVVRTDNNTAFPVSEICPSVVRLWESKYLNFSLSLLLDMALVYAHVDGPSVTKLQQLTSIGYGILQRVRKWRCVSLLSSEHTWVRNMWSELIFYKQFHPR